MKASDFQFIKNLTESFAPSGMEGEIRKILCDRFQKKNIPFELDRMGNLVVKKGNGGDVVLSAHMDEVGFMIKAINEDGTLLFAPIGGITPEMLPSKRLLVGKNRIPGIIGAVPIHLKKKDPNAGISYRDLYIDIGANSRKEAESQVFIGDCAVFDTKTKALAANSSSISGKALDDRLGCYLLCKLIDSEKIENATFVFTVQEETGLAGATAFAQNNSYRFGIAVDVTTPNDLPEILGPNRVCELSKGPVISLADGRTVYQKHVVKKVFSLLDKEKIPYQTKAKRAGGNEASPFQKEGAGMFAISLSLPCRYIHGPVGISREEDLLQSYEALLCILCHIQSGDFL